MLKTQKEIAEANRKRAELKNKRDELRTQLAEKRAKSDLTDEYLNDTENQLRALALEIGELNEEIADAPAAMRTADIENMRSNDVTAENFRNHPAYRDAFYRSISNRKVSSEDAEVMAYGKREITDMNGGAVTGGAGYITPQSTLDKITSVLEQYGQIYAVVTKYTFVGDVTLPIGVMESPEMDSEGIYRMKFHFEEVRIHQEALVATIEVKNLLLKNSISALETFISEQLAKFLAVKGDMGVLYGDGENGTFVGIMEKLSAKKYTEVNWKLLTTVIGSLKGAYSQRGHWIMNSQTFWREFMSMSATDGQPIIGTMPIITKNGDKWYILGLPVDMSDAVQVGDFGFGALSDNYVVDESQNIIIESDPSPEFSNDKTVFRGKIYTGGAPILPEEAFVWYTKDSDVAAIPTASPNGGAVAANTEVTLASTTANAKIYYTLDGSEPTKRSKKYSDTNKPKIAEACTLKAIATATGMADSDALSVDFTISG